MPLYEFHCEKCNEVFEKLIDQKNISRHKCPKCKKMAKKIISSGIFVVNGHNAENGYSKK